VKVPLLDLKAQYARIQPEIDAAVARVLASQYFILGPEVESFETEVARYTGSAFAVGCASGSDALLLALMAHGVGTGDEILCPAYTFFATAGAVARLGARPVFADIDPATYNLCPTATAARAEKCENLKAILPVHLFGFTVDLDALLELGRHLEVPVIEDAAQAIGARDARGASAGSRGAAGCFSFFPSKNLGAYGDGGLVTTQDPQLAEYLRALRAHGAPRKYYHEWVGINSRLDALQATVLRVKLCHLDTWNRERAERAAYYDQCFAEAGAAASDVPLADGGLPLRTPKAPVSPAVHIYNQYVIRVPAEQRDGLRVQLTEAGIGSEIYYPLGLHMQKCFAGGSEQAGDLPHTEAAARQTLALPVYPELTQAQQDYVVETIVNFLRVRTG